MAESDEKKTETIPDTKSDEQKTETKSDDKTREAKDTSTDTEIEKVEEKPKPKEYSAEEIESIATKVETPADQTPPYEPKFILSKEFAGMSNYEHGIDTVKADLQKTIESVQDPAALDRAKEDMRKLDHLYENFHIGMNVFRTAKGGRDKLRE